MAVTAEKFPGAGRPFGEQPTSGAGEQSRPPLRPVQLPDRAPDKEPASSRFTVCGTAADESTDTVAGLP